MKPPFAVAAAALLAVLSPSLAAAAEERRTEARNKDVTALVVEGLRTGNVDADAAEAITRWILHEEHEVVARGLITALRSVEVSGASVQDQRWNATAQAMAGLFESALGYAAERRPRDTEGWRELAAVVNAAAPAVAEALRESDPAARETLLRVFRVAAPAMPGLRQPLQQALRHESADVRRAAEALLRALEARERPGRD